MEYSLVPLLVWVGGRVREPETDGLPNAEWLMQVYHRGSELSLRAFASSTDHDMPFSLVEIKQTLEKFVAMPLALGQVTGFSALNPDHQPARRVGVWLQSEWVIE